MNRPRLPFVKEYFQDIANRGNEEAQNLMTEYQEINQKLCKKRVYCLL
jgi:hypothetical protein